MAGIFRSRRWLRRHAGFDGRAGQATFEALHRASLAAPALRGGLTMSSAGAATRHLRALLGTPALAVTDSERVLAWDGAGKHHTGSAVGLAAEALAGGRTAVLKADGVWCGDARCEVREAVVAPLVVEDRIEGALLAYAPGVSAGLVRATGEVARWMSGQLELAELHRSRTRLVEAELRALRAQISPHFSCNALTAIASFVRTDPERARELLLDFADFTRYSFRRHGEFTTLAEEFRSIGQYLLLEQARFGERLQVDVRAAPEVLPVAVPFLCVQPLIENAVRHGFEGRTGPGQITVLAWDAGAEAHITVEDDGVGMDPEHLRRVLAAGGAGSPGGSGSAAATGSGGVGLGNVDARLRQVYGDAYGLVVETALGAGTKVRIRVPKYRAGVVAPAAGGDRPAEGQDTLS
ncbi:sensor histidine kinase [Streptomyces sp. HUAS TT20]|uniref:sensor histidine kinase n=1 Tax=Streptomyces sp. HUAS TT20 TaxID=3447509 RepID=UPI0021D92312|nr:histidine kinase [Streptomyces sp. HUAS 15-9]UXY32032.1 histidine kinase [Streptomyces sp. HUAS 15-9]